jgi:hypothetical protein
VTEAQPTQAISFAWKLTIAFVLMLSATLAIRIASFVGINGLGGELETTIHDTARKVEIEGAMNALARRNTAPFGHAQRKAERGADRCRPEGVVGCSSGILERVPARHPKIALDIFVSRELPPGTDIHWLATEVVQLQHEVLAKSLERGRSQTSLNRWVLSGSVLVFLCIWGIALRVVRHASDHQQKMAGQQVAAAEDLKVLLGKVTDSSNGLGVSSQELTEVSQQMAGEAGKGFAVVANEVKELAKQTAHATEEIGQKIGAIQTDTKDAVQAIGEISTIINQVNDISNTIASAVEEQTVTTTEIGRNVQEAAKGSGEIANNIAGVATAAKTTAEGAQKVQRSSKSVNEMAGALGELVSQNRT